MGSHGHWIVTVATDEKAREWQERFAAPLAAAAEARQTGLAWWASLAETPLLEPYRDRWDLTEAGVHFADTVTGEADDELFDAVMWAAEAAGEAGRFHSAARKGSPVTALHYALGPADAAALPGTFGEFILTAKEVALALPEVERVLGAAGERRAALVERIGRWLDCGADGSATEPPALLDGPLRVFRKAAAERLGLAAATMWF